MRSINRLTMRISHCNTPNLHQQPEWIYHHISGSNQSNLQLNTYNDWPSSIAWFSHVQGPPGDGRTSFSPEIHKSLAPLKELRCVLATPWPKALFSARGENGPWWTRRAGRKVWNHFGSEKGQHYKWLAGHLPSCGMVEMHNIRSASRLVLHTLIAYIKICIFIFIYRWSSFWFRWGQWHGFQCSSVWSTAKYH